MTCGKYSCAKASSNSLTYQVRYMQNTYSAGVPSANIPYQTSSQTTYRLGSGSLGMSGSYHSKE